MHTRFESFNPTYDANTNTLTYTYPTALRRLRVISSLALAEVDASFLDDTVTRAGVGKCSQLDEKRNAYRQEEVTSTRLTEPAAKEQTMTERKDLQKEISPSLDHGEAMDMKTKCSLSIRSFCSNMRIKDHSCKIREYRRKFENHSWSSITVREPHKSDMRRYIMKC